LLLPYVDGELPKRQSRRIERHLKSCWQCRAEMQELQHSVSDCVRYRRQVLIGSLPEVPQAWRELDFDRVEAELAGRSIFSRLGTWLWPGNAAMRWAFSGAFALVLAVVVYRQLRETPKVEAAALLRKAVVAGELRPNKTHRLRIRTATRQMTRLIGTAGLRPAAGEREIAILFEHAKYDWKNPLSARAYVAWHDALVKKLDEVASTDPETYSIRTSTSDSPLISATLKLRRTDLMPVEGRFEFGDHEWVELTELVDQLTSPDIAKAGATGGMPRQPGVPPGPSAAIPEYVEEAANEELQVAAALHQVHADLGDPLEVRREGGTIVIAGIGISPARQQEIHNALDRLPHVTVRFSDPGFPAGTPAPGEPATARDAAAAERPIYTARMEERLGGRPQFEQFSGQILDWTDLAMTRAYALRRLAQQFTAAQEASMRTEDRRALHAIGRDHLAALQSNFDQLASAIGPVLNGIGGRAGKVQGGDPADAWQAESERVLAGARRVEMLVAQVLGVTPPASPSNVPSQLVTALAQLSTEIEHCRRFLSYD
jgi:hypothetical protein